MTIELTNFFKLKFHNTSIENLLLGLSSISAYNSSTVPEKMLELWKIYSVVSYVNIHCTMSLQKINVIVL